MPFLAGGRSWDGWDCWGLVWVAYAELYQIELPKWDGGGLDRRYFMEAWVCEREQWRRIAVPEAGDVVVIRPAHVGLVLNAALFLHAYPDLGTCLSRLDRQPWRDRIEGYYQHHRKPAY